VLPDALGVTQAELVAYERTVVVGEQVDGVEPERVEQRHDVGEQLVARVASPGGPLSALVPPGCQRSREE
jgi:hypothetical protein